MNVLSVGVKTSTLFAVEKTSVLLARDTVVLITQPKSASLLTACWCTPFAIRCPRSSDLVTRATQSAGSKMV